MHKEIRLTVYFYNRSPEIYKDETVSTNGWSIHPSDVYSFGERKKFNWKEISLIEYESVIDEGIFKNHFRSLYKIDTRKQNSEILVPYYDISRDYSPSTY